MAETSGKKQCISNNSNENETKSSKKETDKTVNVYCKLNYDVLILIFENLNAKDLSNAVMVCRLWQSAARRVKNRRDFPIVMEYEPDKHCKFMLENLAIKPRLGIYLLPKTCFKVLPRNCDLILIESYGIIFNDKAEESYENIVCSLLPEPADIKIKSFTFRKNFFANSILNIEELITFFDNSNTNERLERCLILLCDSNTKQRTLQILRKIKRRYPGDNISYWGGVVRRLLLLSIGDSDKCILKEFPLCIGIALMGPSIRTWSIILDEMCTTEKEIRCKLMALKTVVSLQRHSIAFLMSCHSRENEKEIAIFVELFPNIPLIGTYADGEFGREKLLKEKYVSYFDKQDILFYSSVFMILSYGVSNM
ncbi:F-box only protein 22-like isoform X2 [Prorops nasuta]|uniref:F-box only protein 22-like isoform X2 n=1 Tax=Prorops nasuta TaxID=863751 RepID=UPI0034CDE465